MRKKNTHTNRQTEIISKNNSVPPVTRELQSENYHFTGEQKQDFK